MSLPNLSQLSHTSVPVHVENSRELESSTQLQNVPADGSCLYHCLVALRGKSTAWLGDASPFPQDATMLKYRMARYFLNNYETQFMNNWHSYLRQYFKIPIADADRYNGPVTQLANKYINEVMMQPNAWGGDLEIDIASHLFGVIIHKFERETINNNSTTARLITSFYPTPELNDRGRVVTKWVLVLSNTHFNYIIPSRPLNASTRPPAAVPESTAPGDTARKRADMMKAMKDRRSGKRPDNGQDRNAFLKQLANERHARAVKQPANEDEARENSAQYCALYPIQLSPAEQEELDAAVAREMEAEEEKRDRQIREERIALQLSPAEQEELDAAVAREMEAEEEKRDRQIREERIALLGGHVFGSVLDPRR